MRAYFVSLMASTWSNFGYCQKCLRKSFFVAATGWLAVLLLPKDINALISLTVIIGSVMATLLWLLHIIAFALRSMSPSIDLEAGNSRRDMFPLFARAIAVAAVASAISKPAFAESACGGWNGECTRCQRRNTSSSPCEYCRSCGNNCPQNNNC